MQIREIDLTELETVYEVLKQLHTELSFKEFDDLIYDMRHIEYKMIGLFDKGELITYAGVCVMTNFRYKRHLRIEEIVTDKKYADGGHTQEMLEYLEVYAKTAMCTSVLLVSNSAPEDYTQQSGFWLKNY